MLQECANSVYVRIAQHRDMINNEDVQKCATVSTSWSSISFFLVKLYWAASFKMFLPESSKRKSIC